MTTETRLWLVELTLDLLSNGQPHQDPYLLADGAIDLLSAGIGVVLHERVHALEELVALVRLADVLKRKHRSLAAAANICGAIEAEPRALEVLGLATTDEMRERASDGARLLDHPTQHAAPSYGAPDPPGTQKIGSYLAHRKGARR